MAARESLFDVLKRSPWWLSFAIAIGIAASLQVFFPWAFALFAALPFAVIAGYSAWKQRGIPGEARTASVLGELRALNREAFFAVIGDSYRSAGFQVDPHDGADADFRLTRGGRSVLLVCRGWKAAQAGVGPLKDLREAMRRHEAGGAYVAAGEVSDTARQYAAAQRIELLEGAALAKLVAKALRQHQRQQGAGPKS